MWYPIPFVLIGVAATWLARRPNPVRWIAQFGMLAALVVQLSFFTEQLRYIQIHGGVPNSLLDRSYAGLREDSRKLADRVAGDEIWVEYCGPSSVMAEGLAYYLRSVPWRSSLGQRALIRYRAPFTGACEIIHLAQDDQPSPQAFLVHPWSGPSQRGGHIVQK